MKTTTIRRVHDPVPLVENTTRTVWDRADRVSIDRFLWTSPERQPRTTVRMLYNDETLYLHYTVVDRHSYARTTTLNGPVWEDSCVEFFANPRPADRAEYVNFEANCVGTFHLGYGTSRTNRVLVDPELADDVQIQGSMDVPTKRAGSTDEGWWLAVGLPFDMLSAFTGVTINPSRGTRWRGNFYRLRKQPNPFYGAWSPVNAPEPDFHRPTDFGELRFQ